MDDRVVDPATDAFDRIPAEAQPVYLEEAESVYSAIWQILRPAVAAKAGEAIGFPKIGELVDSEEISEIEDAAVEMIAGVKDVLSVLSDGFYGERSEARARIERIGSRLNSLESGVRMVVNALGIDTVSRLLDPEEK